MSYLILGFSLLVFWAGWGLGLALWILPPVWRRYLWALCLPFGMSLQIAVVWFIAMSGGTVQIYGRWLNLLPTIVLISALLRRKTRGWFFLSLRSRIAKASSFLAIFAVTLVLLPGALSKFHPGELTTFSFGSCDAPDYAMGVRLFLEKGRSFSDGFWGQSEVHQLSEGMSYWTYWTRLNHFGAAALMAMMASSFRLEIWQIGTVMAGALTATAVPIVLGFARYILRLRWSYSVGISILYALSPICLYAVFHVALAQLVGATSIGGCLLLSCHIPKWGCRSAYLKAILTGSVVGWLLLSSYTFMALFAGLLILSIAGCHSLFIRSFKPLVKIVIGAGAVGVVCGILFPLRLKGFWEGIYHHGGGVFGWSVGPMYLQTVIGLPADRSLNPLDAEISIPLLIGLSSFWLWGIFNAWRRRDSAFFVVVPTTTVILGLCYIMVAIDPMDEHLNSYKAYKLIAVFLPALLPSLFIGFKYPVLSLQRFVTAAFLIIIALFLPRPLTQIWKAAEYMPLRVSSEFARLADAEKDPAIQGVNIVSASVWTRLWTSAFLADKRQYFKDATYISRGAVPLQGEWTVEDDLHGVYPPRAKHFGNRVVLRPTEEPAILALFFGPGWWQDEEAHRWSGSTGKTFYLYIEARSAGYVDLAMEGVFKIEGTHLTASVHGASLPVSQEGERIVVKHIPVAEGRTEIYFQADRAPVGGRNKSDPRVFLYKLTGIELRPSLAP